MSSSNRDHQHGCCDQFLEDDDAPQYDLDVDPSSAVAGGRTPRCFRRYAPCVSVIVVGALLLAVTCKPAVFVSLASDDIIEAVAKEKRKPDDGTFAKQKSKPRLPNRLLLRVQGDSDDERDAARQRIRDSGCIRIRSMQQALGIDVIELESSEDAEKALDKLLRKYGSIIQHAAVDRMTEGAIQQGHPHDPMWQTQWGMRRIHLLEAWGALRAQTACARETIVAVVDTGVDVNHPDLRAKIYTNPGEIPGNGLDDDGNGFVDDVHGWDFVAGGPNVMDPQSHGTHCAGIVDAVADNGRGVVGVSSRIANVKILPCRWLDAAGNGWWGNAL